VGRDDMTSDQDALASVIADSIAAALAPLRAKIAALEAQQQALEQKGLAVEYRGIFQRGTTYARGTLVTQKGGLWLALATTTTPPGSDAMQWRLIVKSGHAA
jgi:hypothetical protein